MEDDRKILNTAQLIEMNDKAAETGLLTMTENPAKIDPAKFHICSRIATRDSVHKVLVLLGLTGRKDPARSYLQIRDEDWAELPDATKVLARERGEGG